VKDVDRHDLKAFPFEYVDRTVYLADDYADEVYTRTYNWIMTLAEQSLPEGDKQGMLGRFFAKLLPASSLNSSPASDDSWSLPTEVPSPFSV